MLLPVASLPTEVGLDPVALFLLGCVGVTVICLLGLALLLKGLGTFRANLADELKRLVAPNAATQVEIQSPLETKKHNPCATAEDLLQVHGRLKREKAETDAKLAALAEEDRRLRDHLEAHQQSFNARIDEIPARTIALLNETKQLHQK